jgi:hypothetical protein
MPLNLEDGWNQLTFNIPDYVKKAYGTNYTETSRIQVHANCKVRRIYFADKVFAEEELPPELKLYMPLDSKHEVMNYEMINY